METFHTPIQLKGTGGGLRLFIPEELAEEEIMLELERISKEAGALLGLQVILDFQGRKLSQSLVGKIVTDFIWARKVVVSSWITYDVESQNLLRSVGISIGEPTKDFFPRKGKNCDTLFLVRSLRSGQRIEHGGDVIIIGHVNDGAEVIASGNICIWGRLKGLAHAGSDGDEGQSIIVGDFQAKQVRLGHKVGSYLDSSMEWWGRSVLVSLEKDSLFVRELKI
ncbi:MULTISPECIES: septum site-determining protein MinC [Aminobacterium]|mgnify:FL=1|jgi:septum site-determining protein MinC|uniref:septum site-determining protein MinC n=1 Tax=Aminobacterium TaxID=81466 RepID=UPI00257A2850|nr:MULTISPECIES: septum site-determining protein MinC [unclassified Aminobacterium]